MSIKPNKFSIQIAGDMIDMADLTERDWERISIFAKSAIKEDITKDVSKAYIIGFLMWLSDIEELKDAIENSGSNVLN